jgi:hypothetical protein
MFATCTCKAARLDRTSLLRTSIRRLRSSQRRSTRFNAGLAAGNQTRTTCSGIGTRCAPGAGAWSRSPLLRRSASCWPNCCSTTRKLSASRRGNAHQQASPMVGSTAAERQYDSSSGATTWTGFTPSPVSRRWRGQGKPRRVSSWQTTRNGWVGRGPPSGGDGAQAARARLDQVCRRGEVVLAWRGRGRCRVALR